MPKENRLGSQETSRKNDKRSDGGDVFGRFKYKGPIDDNGKWSPRGGYEMIIHSHISEDDNERKTWVAPTADERTEFRQLMIDADGLDIASPEFATRVAASIARGRARDEAKPPK